MPVARSSPHRLYPALAGSLALHLAVLVAPGQLPRAPTPARPALMARLMPLPETESPKDNAPLLKNTLSDHDQAESQPAAPPPPLSSKGTGAPKRLAKAQEERALRKLSAHVYYPPEAIDRGLEGEVRLLLLLDEAGRILSADIAAGSGHAILDRAAQSAALSMGSLPGTGLSQLILPVVFRLQ